MGYHQRFSRTIYVRYSGSVSYPASEHGGTQSYSGTTTETVDIDIYVDTDPFDRSVNECNNVVSGLTTSVATMSAAQVAAIDANAKKVGSTIINGFFSTVKSEISQQITELRSNIDATLLRLHELAKQCADKQRQMKDDYARITSRYMKIFDELDKECENRIFELDRPAFNFKRTTDQTSERATCNDMVATAAVSGGENGIVEARIEASHTKRRAMEALGRANAFLSLQRRTENIIAQSTFINGTYGVYYAPVCYLETCDSQTLNRKTFSPSYLSRLDNAKLVEQMRDLQMENSANDAKQLQTNFNQVVGTHYANSDVNGHDARVRDYVTKLFKNNINK